MATHDYVIANQSHTNFRSDLNNALAAIVGWNSNAGDPATMFARMRHVDTTLGVVKRRNAANNAWIYEGTDDETRVLSRSSNTILDESDITKLLLTTGSFTQTLTAAATLKDGWWIRFRNNGTGVLTFDANGAETINGATTLAVGPGVSGILLCDGSNFTTVGMPSALPVTVTYSSTTSIVANTSDGADTAILYINGGGGTGSTRGAQLFLGGNEAAIFGPIAQLSAGNVAGAYVELITNGNFLHLNHTGNLLLGDTANANNTLGFTINQGAADDQILTLKSSDVAHGLTSAGAIALETDDFYAMQKNAGATGGVIAVALAESTVPSALHTYAYSGTASVTDTTASIGPMTFRHAEHDGANALVNAPANANLCTWHAWSAGAWTTRMLLKADDGELHLGNTTLQALDGEDDVMAVRGLQIVRTRGRGVAPTRFDRPAYSYRKLRELGIVGAKDRRGEFLIRVQPYLNLHDGAIWQLYTMFQDMNDRLVTLTRRLERKSA